MFVSKLKSDNLRRWKLGILTSKHVSIHVNYNKINRKFTLFIVTLVKLNQTIAINFYL